MKSHLCQWVQPAFLTATQLCSHRRLAPSILRTLMPLLSLRVKARSLQLWHQQTHSSGGERWRVVRVGKEEGRWGGIFPLQLEETCLVLPSPLVYGWSSRHFIKKWWVQLAGSHPLLSIILLSSWKNLVYNPLLSYAITENVLQADFASITIQLHLFDFFS